MEKITRRLFEMQDLTYRDFQSKLVPNVDKETVIGVRTPALRAYVKELSYDDKLAFMQELPHKYMEENSLHGFMISSFKTDINTVFEYLEKFLPYVDNWATCDGISPKIFKKYPDEVLLKIGNWIKSDHTYTVRFAIVSLLQFYLDEQFDAKMLEIVAGIDSSEYYINMAIAWYFSFALIKQYESTIPFFETPTLSKIVHNKSIQKAVESFRIDDEKKNYLRSLRII